MQNVENESRQHRAMLVATGFRFSILHSAF